MLADRLLLTVLLAVHHSPLVLTHCSEEEFTEVRRKYEECASQKIENITELLQTQGNTDTRQDVVLCDQVKELINHCGELLDQCFQLEQVIIKLIRYNNKVSHPTNTLAFYGPTPTFIL